MSGTLPWAQTTTQMPPPNNLADSMQRIERNTAEMVLWVKILVVVVVLSILLDVFFVL